MSPLVMYKYMHKTNSDLHIFQQWVLTAQFNSHWLGMDYEHSFGPQMKL